MAWLWLGKGDCVHSTKEGGFEMTCKEAILEWYNRSIFDDSKVEKFAMYASQKPNKVCPECGESGGMWTCSKHTMQSGGLKLAAFFLAPEAYGGSLGRGVAGEAVGFCEYCGDFSEGYFQNARW